MMSRCFTWFPNWLVQENPIYNINRFVLQGSGVFTWMVSDCEELVGSFTGDDGFGFMELVFFKRIGKARTKLKGIEENDNGQGNRTMLN